MSIVAVGHLINLRFSAIKQLEKFHTYSVPSASFKPLKIQNFQFRWGISPDRKETKNTEGKSV